MNEAEKPKTGVELEARISDMRISDIYGLDSLLDDVVSELPYGEEDDGENSKAFFSSSHNSSSSSNSADAVCSVPIAVKDTTTSFPKAQIDQPAVATDPPKRKRGRPKGSKNGCGIRKKKSKSPAKPKLSPEEMELQRIERQQRRRERKNDRERERREAVNSLYDKLGSVMSTLTEEDATKIDKSELLDSAFKRILDMRSQLEALDKEEGVEKQ